MLNILYLFFLLSTPEIQRIEYAKNSHRYFLQGNIKNESAGTYGNENKTLWIYSPRCSKEWFKNIVNINYKTLNNLNFNKIECWERKANSSPLTIYLKKD